MEKRSLSNKIKTSARKGLALAGLVALAGCGNCNLNLEQVKDMNGDGVQDFQMNIPAGIPNGRYIFLSQPGGKYLRLKQEHDNNYTFISDSGDVYAVDRKTGNINLILKFEHPRSQ